MAGLRKQYPFDVIEPKWQQHWLANKTFRADDSSAKPKLYVLDMFPYPSGAGLHVGHPEGYTATDIVCRYKRMRGFNVLHPMGWDAFGLPAEQYAIDTGTHPAQTTAKNIATFRRQIQMLGFSYDWDREVDTTDPHYFKWTQWIFLQLFNSYYDEHERKARPIAVLEDALSPEPKASAELKRNSFLRSRRNLLQLFPREQIVTTNRLAYENVVPVWWCEGCKAVLANEEVKDGKCDRKGHTNVLRRPLRQWMLRITKYADRLLEELKEVDWSESIKEMQRNWIGRSEGAEVNFEIEGKGFNVGVFTTRPDTLFGATYMVLAPEHPIVETVTTDAQRAAVMAYREAASKKSELDRTDLAKEKSGVFTGGYAINPVNSERIPIWTADYVMISYGTGAIMAVPAHDERDLEFAKKFGLDPVWVVEPLLDWVAEISRKRSGIKSDEDRVVLASEGFTDEAEFQKELEEIKKVYASEKPRYVDLESGEVTKAFAENGIAVNSPSLAMLHAPGGDKLCNINNLSTEKAKKKITSWIEERDLGKRAINYKLRDWLFSRQRYWGEPIPVVHCGKCGVVPLPESALPLTLPEMKDYTPPASGEPPLAKATEWVKTTCPQCSGPATRETNTMPQWAGSCWYYLRFIDPKNAESFCAKEKEKHWMPVDLYVGGAEHAVLHLLYSRFWHKVLFDLGHVSTSEPFTRLVNQGMILGEDGQKMSKSRGNVLNPDDIVRDFGADSMRLYEMFMGPLEATKPWSTDGIQGVHRFLGRVWRLFVGEKSNEDFEQAVAAGTPVEQALAAVKISPAIQDVAPTTEQQKILHATIKAVTDDLDAMGFNTSISRMMEFVNEFTRATAAGAAFPRSVAEKFLLLLAPFAPHLAEQIWALLGHKQSLAYEPWPGYDAALLVTKEVEVVLQVNGKLRDRVKVPVGLAQAELEKIARANDKVAQHMAGKTVRKVVVVPDKLVNIVAT